MSSPTLIRHSRFTITVIVITLPTCYHTKVLFQSSWTFLIQFDYEGVALYTLTSRELSKAANLINVKQKGKSKIKQSRILRNSLWNFWKYSCVYFSKIALISIIICECSDVMSKCILTHLSWWRMRFAESRDLIGIISCFRCIGLPVRHPPQNCQSYEMVISCCWCFFTSKFSFNSHQAKQVWDRGKLFLIHFSWIVLMN